MDLEYILNELSISDLLPGIQQANEAMDVFIDVLKSSRDVGIRPSIRTHADIRQIELASGYFVSSWCTDQGISRDKRLYILKLATNTPLLAGLPEELVEDTKEVAVRFGGVVGKGLTIAHLTGNPVLSFNTHRKWEPPELEVNVEKLRVDGLTGEVQVIEQAATVINFAVRQSLEANKEKVRARLATRFDSPEEFWTKKESLFSRLEFSPDILSNLKGYGTSNPVFLQVMAKFVEINAYCSEWKDGPCKIIERMPNVSRESAATMKQFGESRKFKNGAGEYHLCELHARVTPGANRIHFFPLTESRKIFIGYTGKKLPTVTTST